MLDWRIYYGDESTFSSDDGEPQDAPSRDVQVIASPYERVGRRLVNRHDFYWYDVTDREWRGGDFFGFWDYLTLTGLKIPKFGRNIKLEDFDAIYQRAKNDPDFPRKSAMLPGGRKE